MKSKLLYLFFGLSLALFVFNSNSQGRAFSQSAGNTGAPGDQTLGSNPRTCVSCHGVGSSTIQVAMDLQVADATGNSIDMTGYSGGETYDVTVTVNTTAGMPTGFGFQAVALAADLNVNGPQAGSWSDAGMNVRIASANNRSYAEQNGTSNSNEFKFKWNAPNTGTGKVSFYVCGNGVNRNNSTTGDGADCLTLVLDENITSSTKDLSALAQVNVFPNPAQEFVQLQLNGEIAGDYELILTSSTGQILIQQNIQMVNGDNQHMINISNLPSGLYGLGLRGEEGSFSQTIIKF